MIISGQYVASDLQSDMATPEDRAFAQEVLGVELIENPVQEKSGRIVFNNGKQYNYSNTLNDKIYIVEYPDLLVPAPGAKTNSLFTFSGTNADGGFIVDRGKGKNAVLSLPIETLTTQQERNEVMHNLLKELGL